MRRGGLMWRYFRKFVAVDQQSALSLVGSKVLNSSVPCLDSVIMCTLWHRNLLWKAHKLIATKIEHSHLSNGHQSVIGWQKSKKFMSHLLVHVYDSHSYLCLCLAVHGVQERLHGCTPHTERWSSQTCVTSRMTHKKHIFSSFILIQPETVKGLGWLECFDVQWVVVRFMRLLFLH